MTVTEMLTHMNGLNEKDEPKSGVNIDLALWSTTSDEIKDVKAFTFVKPEVQIQRRGNFINIDLKFITPMDRDCMAVWDTMQQYGDMLDAVQEEDTHIPFLSLTIAPIEWDWMFYATAISPIYWCLQPDEPNGKHSLIRILYSEERVGFYATENLDIATVEANAQRDAELFEQSMIEAEIKREKEKAAYLEKNEPEEDYSFNRSMKRDDSHKPHA